jgi:hypothetical protein
MEWRGWPHDNSVQQECDYPAADDVRLQPMRERPRERSGR